MNNNLSVNLITLMEQNSIGTSQLARIINIPMSTIKNIRKGKNINPTIETLIPLASYFSITLEELIFSDFKKKKKWLNQDKAFSKLQGLPIISWEDAVNWPCQLDSEKWIYTELSSDGDMFALSIEKNSIGSFFAPGLLLVDAGRRPYHLDYVLVKKINVKHIFVKQIIYEEDLIYMKSVTIKNQLTPWDNRYKILGVIFEYRQLVCQQDLIKKTPKKQGV